MGKTFFISDTHLGLGKKEDERRKEDRLVGFLTMVMEQGSRFFIVGDLFDAWFEYKTVIPKGFHRVLTMLEDITRKNISVHYIAGNHDYWMGDFFRDDLGINIYHDPLDMTIDDKRIYLHHGDGLANNDTGYKILKKVLRSPINIKLYKMLHPDIGLALAKSSSKKSRHYTSGKEYGETDGMLSTARTKIEEGYDFVIMGHRHQPAFQRIGNGIYINLGDWITHNTYAILEDGTIELQRWER